MKNINRRHRVRSLIASLGGRAAVAKVTEVTEVSVKNWENAGVIPGQHYGPLDDLACKELNATVARDLFGKPPDKAWRFRDALPSQIVGALPKKIKAAAKT